jgi:hypothetical protein
VKRYEYNNTSIIDTNKVNPFSIVAPTNVLEKTNLCSVNFSKTNGEINITIEKTNEIEVLDLKLITAFTGSSFDRSATGNGRFIIDTNIKELDSSGVILYNENYPEKFTRNALFADVGDTLENRQLYNVKSFQVVTSKIDKTFVKIKVD